MGIFAEQYCHRMNIGSICVSSNVFMAPIYGSTSLAFRRKVEELGAGIAFTEMVYVDELLRGKTRAVEAAQMDPEEPVKAIQLVGKDPKEFRKLCEGPLLDEVDLIDINMGCAVPEILRSGKGCALVHDLIRASKIIEACKRSGKTVSIKCRPGIQLDQDWIRPFARMCEDSGVDMLTVHGRPGERLHEGPVLYETIAAAKSCVSVPVIGNGGICSEEDAVRMMVETGADGIMIGRYGLENPRIFAALTGNG